MRSLARPPVEIVEHGRCSNESRWRGTPEVCTNLMSAKIQRDGNELENLLKGNLKSNLKE